MAHPYKSKASSGQDVAKERYADGGGVGLYGEPGGPTGHPTGAGSIGPNWDLINRGIAAARSGTSMRGQGRDGDDNIRMPMSLKFYDLPSPRKAHGGGIKMPMKLKMLKLKGMK